MFYEEELKVKTIKAKSYFVALDRICGCVVNNSKWNIVIKIEFEKMNELWDLTNK